MKSVEVLIINTLFISVGLYKGLFPTERRRSVSVGPTQTSRTPCMGVCCAGGRQGGRGAPLPPGREAVAGMVRGKSKRESVRVGE